MGKVLSVQLFLQADNDEEEFPLYDYCSIVYGQSLVTGRSTNSSVLIYLRKV